MVSELHKFPGNCIRDEGDKAISIPCKSNERSFDKLVGNRGSSLPYLPLPPPPSTTFKGSFSPVSRAINQEPKNYLGGDHQAWCMHHKSPSPFHEFVRSFVRSSRHRTVLSATVHETLVRRPEFRLSAYQPGFQETKRAASSDTFPRSWTAKGSNQWLFPFRDTKRYLTASLSVNRSMNAWRTLAAQLPAWNFTARPGGMINRKTNWCFRRFRKSKMFRRS